MDTDNQTNTAVDNTADAMGQAYIVIAQIALKAEVLDAPWVQDALDYFSKCEYREDFLPFPGTEAEVKVDV